MRSCCSARFRHRAISLLVVYCSTLAGAGEEPAQDAFRAGALALKARDYEAAIASFELAATLRPQHAGTWLELGIARSALSDWDGALEAYGRVIEIEPTNAKAFHNMGNVRFRRGDFTEAAVDYAKALELAPGYGRAAFHLGWALRQLGRSEEAEGVFRRCVELPATDPASMRVRVDCTFGLGSVRHRAGDYAASAALMEQVLAVHPGHPEARYYLAISYRQLGRLEDAARELEVHREILAARRQSPREFEGPDAP